MPYYVGTMCFAEMPRNCAHPVHVLAALGFFRSQTEFFLNDRKKLSQFGQYVQK